MTESTILTIKEEPVDLDTQICHLSHTYVSMIFVFIMHGVLKLYHTQGFFINCATTTGYGIPSIENTFSVLLVL